MARWVGPVTLRHRYPWNRRGRDGGQEAPMSTVTQGQDSSPLSTISGVCSSRGADLVQYVQYARYCQLLFPRRLIVRGIETITGRGISPIATHATTGTVGGNERRLRLPPGAHRCALARKGQRTVIGKARSALLFSGCDGGEQVCVDKRARWRGRVNSCVARWKRQKRLEFGAPRSSTSSAFRVSLLASRSCMRSESGDSLWPGQATELIGGLI